MTFNLRPPTVDDADRLGAVHVAAWQAAYRGGLMPDDYLDGLSADERASMWRDGLSRPSRPRFTRLLAEDPVGTVAGFITVGPADGNQDNTIGEVYALNVHPDSWGRGCGQALLVAGTAALAHAGFPDAVLWVHRDNNRARRFYEQSSWEADGSSRDQEVLDVLVPEVRYRRSLT